MVDQLYLHTKAENNQVFKEHSDAILISLFNNFLERFLLKFADYSSMFKQGFVQEGIFNIQANKDKAWHASTIYGRQLVYSMINDMIDAYPLDEKYKAPLKKEISNIIQKWSMPFTMVSMIKHILSAKLSKLLCNLSLPNPRNARSQCQ